jgi:hypothetical protein
VTSPMSSTAIGRGATASTDTAPGSAWRSPAASSRRTAAPCKRRVRWAWAAGSALPSRRQISSVDLRPFNRTRALDVTAALRSSEDGDVPGDATESDQGCDSEHHSSHPLRHMASGLDHTVPAETRVRRRRCELWGPSRKALGYVRRVGEIL